MLGGIPQYRCAAVYLTNPRMTALWFVLEISLHLGMCHHRFHHILLVKASPETRPDSQYGDIDSTSSREGLHNTVSTVLNSP